MSSISSHSMNGDHSSYEHVNASEYQPTYAEAFPPLQAPSQMYDPGESAWNTVKPVPQSKVTQVNPRNHCTYPLTRTVFVTVLME